MVAAAGGHCHGPGKATLWASQDNPGYPGIKNVDWITQDKWDKMSRLASEYPEISWDKIAELITRDKSG